MTGPRKMICMIVAMDRARSIGRGGEMPWHLPADLRHFKRTTLGHPVLMGRKTFVAIGRPLPGRQNVVITRDEAYRPPGVDVAHDLEEALHLAAGDKVFIIGGGEIYCEAMPLADRLFVTEVDTLVDGADTWFPPIDPDRWREVERRHRPADESNPYGLDFVVYESCA